MVAAAAASPLFGPAVLGAQTGDVPDSGARADGGRDPAATVARTFDDDLLTALLTEQDHAYAAEDRAAYFAHYEMLHGPATKHLAMVLLQAWGLPGKVQRTSRVLRVEPRGSERSIAYVESTFTCGSGRPGTSRNSLLILGHDSGRVVDTDGLRVLAELEYESAMVRDRFGAAEFRCAGCNYSMTADPARWVMLPQPASTFGGLESVGFYSLWSDLAVQVAVHADDNETQDARTLLRAWLAEEQRTNPGKYAATPTIEDWRPSGLPQTTRATGARVAYEFDDAVLETRRRSVFHVLALGDLHYLFDIEGSVTAHESEGDGARAVLDSFRVLDKALVEGSLARHARRMMKGSRLADRRFRNDLVGITFERPEGWSGRHPLTSEPVDFLLREDTANDPARIRLRCFPTGTPSLAVADGLVDRLLAKQGTDNVRLDSGWRPVAEEDPGFAAAGRAESADADAETDTLARSIEGTCRLGRFRLWLIRRGTDVLVFELRGDTEASLARAASVLRSALRVD